MNASHSIGRLKSYPAYKPSGVEWLEEVPEHWEVRRLKQICQLAYGDSLSAENRAEGDIPVYGSNGQVGVHNTANTLSPCIIIGRKGSFGKVSYLGRDAFAIDTTFFIDDRHTNADLGWLSYALPLLGLDQFSHDSAVPGLNRNDAYERILPLPPLPEQHAIVRYLDYVDRRIRRYTSAKRKLIALLEEERQAVVNQAVTRGLDPNVRLKPSGIEWLGDVPEHWERCRLRNVVSVVTTGSRGWSSYASDTGPLFIRVANLSRGSLELRFDDTVRLDLPKTSEMARTRIQRGDLLVSVTAYIGSIAVAPDEFEEAYVSQHVARCQPLPGSSSRWLGYVLLSTVGQTHGQISLYGGTKDGLSLDDVKDYPMLIPPLDEQTSIVKHLERATAAIDAAITRARRQVELVEEYRTRLIADVVTGKLDVREAAAQLPDEAEDDVPIGEGDLQQNGMAGALHNAEEEPAFAEEVTA